jgi:hypothetical protein
MQRISKLEASRYMAKGIKTGGRAPGTPNKATAEIKALARESAPKIVTELARLALKADSEQVRVAAGRELLDRGYGRPAQVLTGEEDKGPIIVTWAGASAE